MSVHVPWHGGQAWFNMKKATAGLFERALSLGLPLATLLNIRGLLAWFIGIKVYKRQQRHETNMRVARAPTGVESHKDRGDILRESSILCLGLKRFLFHPNLPSAELLLDQWCTRKVCCRDQ